MCHRIALLFTIGLLAASEEEGANDTPPDTQEEGERQDPWDLLTKESWQPGRVGEFNMSFPVKDIACEGPSTRLTSVPGLTWAVVKERLARFFTRPFNPFEDAWLFRICAQIQQEEPDNCVLGVSTTAGFLLPATMPKYRNMARTLNTDHNIMILNMTFYDTLRSGFPVFAMMDGLATSEYRLWLSGEEAAKYFAFEPERSGCLTPAAQRLQSELRLLWNGGGSLPALVSASLNLFISGEALASSPFTWKNEVLDPAWGGALTGCPMGVASALIVLAWEKAQAPENRQGKPGHREALRDLIELVGRAEELIRSYAWGRNVAFGMLVASDWYPWLLLDKLQLAMKGMLMQPWALPDEEELAASYS